MCLSRKDRAFIKWLNEDIELDNFKCSRRSCIQTFVGGLWQFITSHGYRFHTTELNLRNCIATGLYENARLSHIQSNWNYPVVNTEPTIEELDHYHFVLDSVKWESFWDVWGNWSDVSTNSFRGQDRRLDIQHFIWGQLDLANSYQTGVLEEIIKGGEEEYEYADRKHTSDVYLQEAVEYNGWAGYRH